MNAARLCINLLRANVYCLLPFQTVVTLPQAPVIITFSLTVPEICYINVFRINYYFTSFCATCCKSNPLWSYYYLSLCQITLSLTVVGSCYISVFRINYYCTSFCARCCEINLLRSYYSTSLCARCSYVRTLKNNYYLTYFCPKCCYSICYTQFANSFYFFDSDIWSQGLTFLHLFL